jgi:hypothetical protein
MNCLWDWRYCSVVDFLLSMLEVIGLIPSKRGSILYTSLPHLNLFFESLVAGGGGTVLGFELSALCFLARHPTTWDTSAAICFSFFFSRGTRVWFQGSAITRQVLYHLSHSFSFFFFFFFFFGNFADRVYLFTQASLNQDSATFRLPMLSGMIGIHHNIQLFYVEIWRLVNYFLTWNCNSPDLSLCVGCQVRAVVPSDWLR